MEQVQAYTEEQLTEMGWAFEKSGAPAKEASAPTDYTLLETTPADEQK